MSANVLVFGAVIVLVALIVAFVWLQSRPQESWLGGIIRDSGGLGGIVGAFV